MSPPTRLVDEIPRLFKPSGDAVTLHRRNQQRANEASMSKAAVQILELAEIRAAYKAACDGRNIAIGAMLLLPD